MFKRTLVTTLLFSTAAAHASDYQFELHGEYTEAESDYSEQDNITLQGTYYFNPVSTDGHVLAEAAFMERASNISVGATRTTTNLLPSTSLTVDGPVTRGGYEYTSEQYSARGEWYLPGDLFYVAAGVAQFDYRQESSNAWSASLGVTPVEGLLISSDFYEDQELDETWNLNAKYVTDGLGPTLAITSRYNYYDRGDDSLRLGIDYYLNRTFSIGVERSEVLGGNTPNNILLRTRKFLTDRWSLSAYYDDTDYAESFGVSTSLRF